MSQKLVIVESPAKAKTIRKYLGKNYIVEASMGHIRDLPKSQLGVDVENNYNPKYITIRGKGELIDKLKKAAKKSDQVFLATDPDREGEAISWHLSKILGIPEAEKCRIEFNEITKNAVKNSIKHPRAINTNLVDAQQARRIVDRLVGYEISPILWKNVKWGLSAGRVQSAALKLICDREKEIEKFEPKEYWTIESLLKKGSSKFTVKLHSHKGEKIEINSEEIANNIIKELANKEYVVESVKESRRNKNPLPPFTTSTLQQDAYKKLNYSTKKTMSVAQQLYEGVEIKGHGAVGLITYMRTDSVRISEEAQALAKSYIENNFGSNYVPDKPRIYKSKKNIQDAHEAIRPSNIEITPDLAKASLTAEQYKVYKLVWDRFLASQMSSALIDITTINIANGNYVFRTTGSIMNFDGFMKIYEYINEDEEENSKFPKLKEKDILEEVDVLKAQHFTTPPPRYTEASFVKLLEEKGIGRPSTYVPTISTLLDRKYIQREKKSLSPTELGVIVNNILEAYFKEIVDVDFTAEMESDLDYIEDGKNQWTDIVDKFFKPLKKSIDIAEKEVSKVTIEDKVSDVPCDKCGRMMVIKQGRYGTFLACPGYPDCKNTKPIVEEIDVPCPECGGKVVVKRSKRGRKFYGCSNYPECNFVSWYQPTNVKCDKCNSYTLLKYNKTSGEYYECSNKECKNKIIIK